ncbi:MAG TPA: hypothetical protein VIJ40_08865 [Acidimicrobiales bacterium]
MTTAAGTLIAGVTAGTTSVKFDCNVSSSAAIVAEASALAAAGTTNVIPTGLADTSALGLFAAAATDTGCPAATAGQCEIATFLVPATFTSAGDTNAVCPPSAAQINAGIFGCALAVATAAQAPVTGAEYLMQYASQAATSPNAPTISALQTTGSAGSQINVSDATGNTGYWWGSGLQLVQAAATGTAPVAAPATCSTGVGYGDVPAVSPFLFTLWYPAGSTTPIPGSATGVTISNDCYNGTTLTPPALGGTITVPATVTSGTAYTVYLCELNTTTYAANAAGAACGTTGGASWIAASFPFTATAGVISQNLPQAATVVATSSGTFTSQLVTSGGTGAPTYTQVAGSPSIVVSSSGAVTTSGALAAGVYTATGTTKDTATGTGTFTFALTVTAAVTPPPPPPVVVTPKATKVTGEAIPGRTVVVGISGSHFTKGSKITGHAGTTATVLATSATHLKVRVKEASGAKKGTYTFTIKFTNGKRATVRYIVK